MTAAHSEHAHDSHAAHTHHPNYIKIWAVLVVLLVVSVVGPMAGIQAVTLATAFGVALVKAYLVATRFMHLNVEKKYINYLLLTAVVFMLLLFSATAPDIMKHSGQRWENKAAQAAVERGLAAGEHDAHSEHAAPASHDAPHH